MSTLEEINKWLKQDEGLNLEFKTAKAIFSVDKDLPDYCAALANERGGKLILGVGPDGKVVGTNAFKGTHNTLSHKLLQKIQLRVDVEEFTHPNGRIIIFHVPSRPIGRLVQSTGKYHFPMRAGESLTEMDQQTIKRILDESSPDFSSKVINGEKDIDKALDLAAVDKFKKLWLKKRQSSSKHNISNEQMLKDLGLLTDKGINYACLILLGNKEKINQYLPDAEILFEWRQNSKSIPHDFRKGWKEPFINVYDDIAEVVLSRNSRYPYQEGLIQWEIYAFDEKSIREALLNAVAHRDYATTGQSIFIKASSEKFVVTSPGGFLPGITPENIIYKTQWRNRRLAEALEKVGLVERSGQGLNDIFEKTIRDGKGMPELSKSDAFSVTLEIPAKVQDQNFILFLENVNKEKNISLNLDYIFELEKIRENKKSDNLERRRKMSEMGIIEKVGKGRGTKYILSHRYYQFSGRPGIHTRLRGTSREQKKQLILNHLENNYRGTLADFKDVFPELKPMSISNLLRELKKEEKITYIGAKHSGYWKLKE